MSTLLWCGCKRKREQQVVFQDFGGLGAACGDGLQRDRIFGRGPERRGFKGFPLPGGLRPCVSGLRKLYLAT